MHLCVWTHECVSTLVSHASHYLRVAIRKVGVCAIAKVGAGV